MELQFQTNRVECFKQLKSETQIQEQTQELRLSDGMPEIGRILCVWGQIVVRSKAWQQDSATVNCGVMAWVLYAPEDGSQAQCMETWIPFSVVWDIPEGEQEGTVLCQCTVRSVDARVISGRKMIVRAAIGIQGSVYVPEQLQTYTPPDIPADIQLNRKTIPACLVREVGEKAFMLDEELTLPESAPMVDKLVRYSLLPEITEQKVLTDKVIFRGGCILHILYRTPEGALASWDFDIPFSQYGELTGEYGHNGQAQLLPIVTAMELENGEQGRLRLKAGLSGQYVIYDTCDLTVVADAYSPDRAVEIHSDTIVLPEVLERQTQRIRAEYSAPFLCSRVADVAFYPGNLRRQRRPEELSLEIPGTFQVLYYDMDGVLQSGTAHWQEALTMGLGENGQMDVFCSPSGKPQASPGEAETMLRGEVVMESVVRASEEKTVIAGITAQAPGEKDPARPSLILRKAGSQELWEIAKQTGSTVQAILAANNLQGEPDPDKMLLIPIL